ncbi:hypothetical protein BAUCODRAFT_80004 [Baudoinia panamericana UAMH 10762]|uniref:WW domain-containing protein n=1 Tax=Baudoinia panamericana (strain UAMH 10762) TaxID=717646 RepID=M2M471_BAUPA|nr:uncharacterized protein BAUCODRAFT_80004 [Baudoinia panamericana UAMH 10762]EMC91396.1 hypothetical protein BAUCODRAFT_80004 [Baudoinia panamericana UAMH 10762]
MYGAPTSPPPTGPLPYPDQARYSFQPAPAPVKAGSSRSNTPQQAAEEGRAPGPPGARRQSMAGSDTSSGAGGGGARRARFDAADPHRPTVGGYGQSPPPQQSKLAERRGTPAKNIFPPDSPGGPEPPHKSDDEDEHDEGGTLFSIPVLGRTKTGAPATPAEQPDYQHYYPPPLTSGTGAPAASTSQGTPADGRMHIPDPAGINRLSSTASNATTRASRGSPPPPETPIDPSPMTNVGLTGIEARYAASGIPGTDTLNEMQAQSAAAAARRAEYQQRQPQPQPQRQATPTQRQGTPTQRQATPTQRHTTPLAQPQPQAQPGARWSPTERPGSTPHNAHPPVAFHGVEEVRSSGAESSQRATYPRPPQPSAAAIEEGVAHLGVHEEPPPAYSPPAPGSVHSPYPNEKGLRHDNVLGGDGVVGGAGAQDPKLTQAQDPNLRQHPAFASNVQQLDGAPSSSSSSSTPHPALAAQPNGTSTPHGMHPLNIAQANQQQNISPGPASPPPLPEGWIAHLDANSGQYYYIHLPTQSTQWEFPKGPTPLNLQEPLSPVGGGGAAGNPFAHSHSLASPVGSVFKQPLASPGFANHGHPVPQSATFDPRNSMLSMTSLSSPTATAGFSGPPPSAGVDMYKVAPTNGVYFGPYLRYTNLDLERGLWLGSIMLITDAAQPPTIHIHQSLDLSPNPRQLKAHPIHSHQRWIFYRYDVDLRMEESGPAKWTYAITSHLGCTRYEFLVAGRWEHNWRFVAHSGNDFALNVSANERSRLGGVGLMWRDVLLKHGECGGFHVQIGLGGQIYADRLWKDVPALRQWTQMSGKENRKNFPWSPKLDEDVSHAYFHYYTSHFDQPAIREAFAQIPHICCLDDHEIFDGFGSYPEYMQASHVFKGLGRLGTEMYLLFQHHTTHEILRAVGNDIDLFTITGTGWHFVKYLGPGVVVVGPDTRSERSTNQVLAGPTYQGLFPKIAMLPPSVQHALWLLPVPLVYPRLEAVEQVAQVAERGKKMVTGGFNMLGKVAGGVAGVVGAKGVVQGGFEGVKRAVGKSGLMSSVLSPFGEVEVLDELRDLWTHESKDLERTYIIRTLQGIAHNKSLRMTFLSGSVNTCGAGLLHDPAHPRDHKTMYQLITSSIVNAPTPSYVLKLLNNASSSSSAANNKAYYIPANGHRSAPGAVTDTKEDMMEIFAADVDGRPREMRRLMGRRNYLACVVFDPEAVQGSFHGQEVGGEKGHGHGQGQGLGRLSLAADFMVQGAGDAGAGFAATPLKYGPVIVPSLEYGR